MISLKHLIQAAVDTSFADLKENRNILESLQSSRNRFLKLLVLSRFPIVDLAKIHEFIDSQDQMIERIPNELYQLHFELKSNTLPNLDLYTAIDVLLTGKYRQLPLILGNIIPSIPNEEEEDEAYKKLDRMIEMKLYCDDLLPAEFTKGMVVRHGLVEILIVGQFCLHLTLLVGSNSWRIMKLEILVESNSLEYEGKII
jgi:hypothetical protein